MDRLPGDEELADRVFRATVGCAGRTDVVAAVLEVVSEALAETTDTPTEFSARLDRIGYVWFRSN